MLYNKDGSIWGGTGGAYRPSGVKASMNLQLELDVIAKSWSTPTARDHFGEYNLDKLVRKDGKSRLDQLGNQVRYTEEDVEKCRQLQSKNWPTPLASQRGEDLEVYIRKSIDRVKKGGVKFAPTLQVAVEAEDKRIEIDNFKKHDINIEDDTEVIVRSIMKDFYKKDSQNTKDTK